MSFGFSFLSDIPIWNNGCIEIERRKSPLMKLRDDRINLKLCDKIIADGSPVRHDERSNFISHMSWDTAVYARLHERRAKTQISLCIRIVFAVSLKVPRILG